MSIFSLLKIKDKKDKKKFKYKLNIKQNDKSLILQGELGNLEYSISGLWLVNRQNYDDKYEIGEQVPSPTFSFLVSISDTLKKICKSNVEQTFDWYLKVICLEKNLSESKRNSADVYFFEQNGEKLAAYLIRCGRFQHTYTKPLTPYENHDYSIDNFITRKGNLSLNINKAASSHVDLQIDTVKSKKGKLFLKGKVFSRSSFINDGKIYVNARNSDITLSSNTVEFDYMKKDTVKRYGLNRYSFNAIIDLVSMNHNELLPEDIYDLFFKVKLHDQHEERLIRVGKPANRARLFLKDMYSIIGNEASVINPYYTFKLRNLSFEIYNYPIETYRYLRILLRFSWIVRVFNKHKNVWLVGERIYKAQDTGYNFFKYMREEYPGENVYYVIDKDSPEKKNVEPLGNILNYKSKEHIWNTIIARKVISSHHPDYLYPLRTPTFKKKVKSDKVFLQHGVMGTKNMVANYGKYAQGFDTDLFMVSSEFEKDMIINDFGYNEKDVFVTGLSRFDQLFANDVKVKRQILIIPTWRDWIITEQAFLESEYYECYKQLINNGLLIGLSHEFKFEILFCLHPNMQQFSKYFENENIKVINQGEVDVQYLIKESALMITDYSSVGFDFSFLHKPVIYYQFDRDKFIGKRQSHLDLDNELPGDIAFNLNSLLEYIQEHAEHDFIMKDKYKIRANNFIKHRDQHASERIYQVIQNNTIKRSFKDNTNYKIISDALYNKFRKNKRYFPIMKLFYKVGKVIIPVDKKMILFESGIGKQYGDSPKDIYEEIVNLDLDYKKVWVYNKQQSFSDANTIKIKRLSPQYYFYLLRARYWVNNQNFPTYITKRSQTTYLQTWHGTPLKKMLYDIDKIQGRNDDYLNRVGQAVTNWDYLISPSPYASNAFRSAFKYDGKIIETGYPRNDIFFKPNREIIKRKVLNRLRLPKDKKVILYAPTFRDNRASKNNKFLFDLEMDLYRMQKQLGNEYILLLRLHVVVQNNVKLDETLSDFVYNVSSYPDIQELQLITDVLITDYSSVMFDFANTGKPMLFFTYDLTEYRDNTRGFYIDFEKEAPGPLVFDTDEIINTLKNINDTVENYKDKYEDFVMKYCLLEDGKASKRVVDRVFR